MNESKKSLTVVMPALNEESNIVATIQKTLEAFKSFNIDGELIIVNDGSSDRTNVLARRFLPEVILLEHKEPQGIGASFWHGAENATKEAVVMIPGDGENGPSEIIKYLELLKHVDMVVPYVINKEVRSLARNLLSACFIFFVNMTFGLRLNYTNGTVVYKLKVLKGLAHSEKGFFYQTEALVKAIRKGYTFAETPYKLNKRKEGTSKAISFPVLKDTICGYLRLSKEIFFTSARRKR